METSSKTINMNTTTTTNELRKGSIVRIATIGAKGLDYTCIKVNNDSNIYLMDCEVINVTPKFFQIRFPHDNAISVMFSKNVFTSTKFSRLDWYGIKPTIVKY